MKSQGLSYFLSNTYRARAIGAGTLFPHFFSLLRIMYIMLNNGYINKAIKQRT